MELLVRVVRHASNLHNRKVTPELGVKTAMKAFVRTVSNNSTPTVFGCAAFVHKRKKIGAINLKVELIEPSAAVNNTGCTGYICSNSVK